MTKQQKEKPLITVVGVLGKQGRSVAQTLIQTGLYSVRGITRRVNTPEALELAGMGVELVEVPLAPGYKQQFVKAFRGSHGVFMLTPGIIPPDTHEKALGCELADAAVEAGVEHVIFSSLENVDRISGGRLFAPHFTDKARVEEYIRTLPIKSSFIYMAFFYTNLVEFYPPALHGDTMVFPIYLPKDFRAPFVDPMTATGPAVAEILANPDHYARKALPVIGDMITPQEMVDTFSRVTGIKAEYSSAYTREGLLRHFPGFGANEDFVRELLGMVEYAVEYGYFAKDKDLEWSRKINPDSLGWEGFLRRTGWRGKGMV